MTIPTIQLRHVPPDEFPMFHKHICPPVFSGDSGDQIAPTRLINRKLAVNFNLPVPGAASVPMWIMADPDDPVGGQVFPSKTVKTVEGDIVHVRVGALTNTHTIHWHGIEPTPMNDGVGKHSFEISGNFTYQFATNQAGTFLYHCHKNTTLHFEMGLYGALIVCPRKPEMPDSRDHDIPGPPYPDGGPGYIKAYNPPSHRIYYDVDALWVPDDIDTRWHTLGHDAFMQKCNPNDPVGADNFTHDGILNDFRPDVFVLSGEARRFDDDTPFEKAAVNCQVGQTVLVRFIDASYSVQEVRIGLPWTLVAEDGFTLGVGPTGQYNRPIEFAADEPLRLTAAMRGDAIIRPTMPGRFPVTIDFLHWISGKKLYTARTFINVS